MIIHDVYVIIRSANERTDQVCLTLVEKFNPGIKCEIINEKPFSAALSKGYKIGIEKNFKWTLFIDADVLLRDDSIKVLYKYAEESPLNVVEVHGLIYDKFFNVAKPAGARLYRTEHLSRAIKILENKKLEIRPEFNTLLELQKEGYPWRGIGYIVGLHDWEQDYKSIFRKFYVHAHKHYEQLPDLLPYFRLKAQSDMDFEVALWGLAAGILTYGKVLVNKDDVPYEYLDAFSKGNFKEKEPLKFSGDLSSYIDKVIKDFLDNNTFKGEDERLLIKENFQNSKYSLFQKFGIKIGDSFIKVGKRLKRKFL